MASFILFPKCFRRFNDSRSREKNLLHLFWSPNNIKVIRTRRLRWTVVVVRMREVKMLKNVVEKAWETRRRRKDNI
jgi:hypothetical protein